MASDDAKFERARREAPTIRAFAQLIPDPTREEILTAFLAELLVDANASDCNCAACVKLREARRALAVPTPGTG